MSRTNSPRILYVEDEDVVAAAVSEFLRQAGYRVLHVTNSDDCMSLFPALEEIRTKNPDLLRRWDEMESRPPLGDLVELDVHLILLDHVLEGSRMTGLELLQWFQRSRHYYHIPCMIYSHRAKLSDAAVAMNYGAVDCIERGNHEHLLAAVAKALQDQRRKPVRDIVWDALKSDSSIMRFVGAKIQETTKDTLPVYLWGAKGTRLHDFAKWITSHTYGGEDAREFLFELDASGSDADAGRRDTERLAQALDSIVVGDIWEIKRFHLADVSAQVLLLRTMEEESNVRFILTGESDPHWAAQEGKLLPELWEHISSHAIEIPSLKERIVASRKEFRNLVMHLLRDYHEIHGGTVVELDDEAWECLYTHDWPRNELELSRVRDAMFSLVKDSAAACRVLTAAQVRECIDQVNGKRSAG